MTRKVIFPPEFFDRSSDAEALPDGVPIVQRVEQWAGNPHIGTIPNMGFDEPVRGKLW